MEAAQPALALRVGASVEGSAEVLLDFVDAVSGQAEDGAYGRERRLGLALGEMAETLGEALLGRVREDVVAFLTWEIFQ